MSDPNPSKLDSLDYITARRVKSFIRDERRGAADEKKRPSPCVDSDCEPSEASITNDSFVSLNAARSDQGAKENLNNGFRPYL